MTIVVDHDTGTLIWAAAGRDTKTLRRFFDALGAERCKLITHVSADAADWIADVVTERCPGAIGCADPFHVVAWATEALDAERRRAWNDARAIARSEPRRGPGRPRKNSAPPPAHERVRQLKAARYALWNYAEQLIMPSRRRDALPDKGSRLGLSPVDDYPQWTGRRIRIPLQGRRLAL